MMIYAILVSISSLVLVLFIAKLSIFKQITKGDTFFFENYW